MDLDLKRLNGAAAAAEPQLETLRFAIAPNSFFTMLVLNDLLRGPEGGIAVRWTSHAGIAHFIRAHGDAITSTSANRPGVPPATSAGEILSQWGDAIARGQLRVLDGGRLRPSPPSTVVDCTGRFPRVIRPGAIPAAVLRESVPNLIGDA